MIDGSTAYIRMSRQVGWLALHPACLFFFGGAYSPRIWLVVSLSHAALPQVTIFGYPPQHMPF